MPPNGGTPRLQGTSGGIPCGHHALQEETDGGHRPPLQRFEVLCVSESDIVGGMRRSTSRIGKLPREVLEQVNEKLYAGWEYPQVREWLFEEVAEEDVPALGLVKGEKFSEVWLRAAKLPANAGHFCQFALGTWYRAHHGRWVREKILRGEAMKTIRRAAVLTREAAAAESGSRPASLRDESAAGADSGCGRAETEGQVSINGGDVLMRSVLIDAISQVTNIGGSAVAPGAMPDSRPPASAREVAQLAQAWARLKQGDVEAEKLKLKTESKLEMAFKELSTELRNDPEAMELFNKLHAVVKRLEEKEKKAGKKAA